LRDSDEIFTAYRHYDATLMCLMWSLSFAQGGTDTK